MRINYPKTVENFLFYLSPYASGHGVELDLAYHREFVVCPATDIEMNGYFISGRRPKLCVAMKKPVSDWLHVLVHESCHMDQWLEGSPLWRDLMVAPWGKSALELFCGAFRGGKNDTNESIPLSEEDIEDLFGRIVAAERDCEERAVEKIKAYDLPIDPSEYIRRANAYLWYHAMIPVLGGFYPTGKEPYRIKEVWAHCPDHFDNDYAVVPKILERAYRTYCV